MFHSFLFVGAMTACLGLAPTTARAQDIVCDDAAELPCRFPLRETNVQRIPAVLKFQARIAQSDLPVGTALFSTAFVKVLNGRELLCLEQFSGVRVVDSTINLEIGANMSCELDTVIAANNDLALQVCLGGVDNCLKPSALGTAPYAIKASFVSIAQYSQRANVATQAHYATRATADRDLLIRNRIGTGWFDFATPTREALVGLFSDEATAELWEGAGFLQWTSALGTGASRSIWLGGRNDGTDALVPLDDLRVMAGATTVAGVLVATPPTSGRGLTVEGGGLQVTGGTTVDGALTVGQAFAIVAGGARIIGDSDIVGRLVVTSRVAVQGGGAAVTGDSQVLGQFTVSGGLDVENGGLQASGDSSVVGPVVVHGPSAGLEVTGNARIQGTLDVGDGLDVALGGVRVVGGGLRVESGGANVVGDSRIFGTFAANSLLARGSIGVLDQLNRSQRVLAFGAGGIHMNPDASLNGIVVSGPARFDGAVVFDGGTVDPAQAEQFLLIAGETRDTTLGGGLAIAGSVQVGEGIAGSLAISGPLALTGDLLLGTGVNGNLAITGGLDIAGAASFSGPLALPGGVTGNLVVQGRATVSGTSMIDGAITTTGAVASGTAASFGGALAISGNAGLTGPVSVLGGITGNTVFGGQVTVAGAVSPSGGLLVENGLLVSGAASFSSPVTLGGGVIGNVTISGPLGVGSATVLNGAASIGGNLTIGGDTRFNGPVAFSGGFAGTTSFENVSASGNLAINGTTAFNGPVNFLAGVSGLDNLTAYLRASGETRDITLPGIVVGGDTSVQGYIRVTSNLGDISATSLRTLSGANLTLGGDLTVDNDLVVRRTLNLSQCRICLNHGDVWGDTDARRRFWCVRMQDGQSTSWQNLSGNVDDNDVIGIKFLCDNGPTEVGTGAWR